MITNKATGVGATALGLSTINGNKFRGGVVFRPEILPSTTASLSVPPIGLAGNGLTAHAVKNIFYCVRPSDLVISVKGTLPTKVKRELR